MQKQKQKIHAETEKDTHLRKTQNEHLQLGGNPIDLKGGGGVLCVAVMVVAVLVLVDGLIVTAMAMVLWLPLP